MQLDMQNNFNIRVCECCFSLYPTYKAVYFCVNRSDDDLLCIFDVKLNSRLALEVSSGNKW